MKGGPTSRADLPPELQAELDALANLSDGSIDTADITIRLDADLVAWYKTHADGKYQTEINRALRHYMQAHRNGDW